jgi:hypothetical protein
MEASASRARLLRVALLAAAWSMSGVWTLGHVLDHALHHEDAHEALDAAAACSADVGHGHSHGHEHPEFLPAALNAKGPQGLALPAADVVLQAPRPVPVRSWVPRAAPARAAPGTGGPSGPRAPPIA